MPTIPLLKTSTDLAMPQVPALDKVKRPSIDVRGVLAAMEDLGNASMRRPVDAEPFVQAAGAKGKAMGVALESASSALTSVSSVLGALAQKRTEEQNRLGIIKAQSAMQAGTQEVQDHFDKYPDKPESFVHHALAVGGRVLKGLGHIFGLDHWGHHSLAHESRTWHRELVAGAQAASDKQLFRNSADAQLGKIYGWLDKKRPDKAGPLVSALEKSHVADPKVVDQAYRDVAEVGGRKEVAQLYAAMREPGFTLEKGYSMVDGLQYVPKEMRPQVKADLTIAHAEFTEQTQVTDLIAKDPHGALAALADGSKFSGLKPATRVALVKSAQEAREHMGALAYTQSTAYINGLDGEQLKAMTPRRLEEAMAVGKDAGLWRQAELFHKKLARHYLALKQGTEHLNDPEARLALEAAIDHHVPDLNGPVEAAHLRMSIEHGFEGAMHDELMKRLDGRKDARVPSVTSGAKALIDQLAYRDNAIGKVRVPMTNGAGAPLHADVDEGDFTGRGYYRLPGQDVQTGKLVPLMQWDKEVKTKVDREATILTRLLEEQDTKEPFKNSQDAVRFVKQAARSRGWQLPEEQGGSEARGGVLMAAKGGKSADGFAPGSDPLAGQPGAGPVTNVANIGASTAEYNDAPSGLPTGPITSTVNRPPLEERDGVIMEKSGTEYRTLGKRNSDGSIQTKDAATLDRVVQHAGDAPVYLPNEEVEDARKKDDADDRAADGARAQWNALGMGVTLPQSGPPPLRANSAAAAEAKLAKTRGETAKVQCRAWKSSPARWRKVSRNKLAIPTNPPA